MFGSSGEEILSVSGKLCGSFRICSNEIYYQEFESYFDAEHRTYYHVHYSERGKLNGDEYGFVVYKSDKAHEGLEGLMRQVPHKPLLGS